MTKTIITVATTGAWPKKENNPNVPMTPAEIAEDVYACWKAGAAVAHLHMRDDNGNGTMSADKFRETVELLRKNHPDCDIILNLTTSGDLNATDETRQLHLEELRPEMGSYDCGSMNWLHSSLFLNHPKFLEELGRHMQEWGVKPEIEAFDPGMIANAAYYLKKGVLKAPLHFQFCMGCANGIPGSMIEAVPITEACRLASKFFVCRRQKNAGILYVFQVFLAKAGGKFAVKMRAAAIGTASKRKGERSSPLHPPERRHDDTMKRIFAFLLIFALLLPLAACGEDEKARPAPQASPASRGEEGEAGGGGPGGAA